MARFNELRQSENFCQSHIARIRGLVFNYETSASFHEIPFSQIVPPEIHTVLNCSGKRMLPALKELAKLADCYLFENGIIENRQLEVYKSYATLCPVYREAKNELTQLKNELFLSEQKVKNFVKTEENKNEYLIKKKNILYKKIILLEKEKSNNSTGGIFK